MVITSGWIYDLTEVNGSTIACMATDSTTGEMGENTKGSINMIRKKGLENIVGLMVEYMKATGKTLDNMGKENIFCKMEQFAGENGKMVEEYVG